MKQLLPLIAFFVFQLSVFNGVAQTPELYGLMSSGGTYGNGSIVSVKADGTNFTSRHSFETVNPGGNPGYGSALIQASNGLLYGMTNSGGSANRGVLFEYNPTTNDYVAKFFFDGTNGRDPYGALVEASNGKLYGMTNSGGSNNGGVLFEYTPGATTIVKKFDFNNTSGSYPYGSLMEASNGKLYGMTSNGGDNYRGTLFEYTPGATTVVKKFDFDNTSGVEPYGSLMEASNGKLYGMTTGGGDNYSGTLFEYAPGATTVVKKYDFNFANGTSPHGTLAEASNGKLYGMTAAGGSNYAGTLFEYTPGTTTITVKFAFDSPDGYDPFGSLMESSNGKLYGMTYSGGSNYAGTLFEYSPGATTITTKFSFDNTNGAYPYGSLMEASNGKLYSMTYSGGSSGYGILYEYSPGATTVVKKIDFNTAIGSNPTGSLVEASNGKLYGLTQNGGITGQGVLFEYVKGSNTIVAKFDFDDVNGRNPYGSLIEASNGKLYGMTKNGGSNNKGVLFEYTPGSNTIVKKFDFDNTNGSSPNGSLVEASNGKLYGMTQSGGNNNFGVLFEYTPGATTVVKKFDFDNTNGRLPFGSLTEASNGKLYGMTYFGGTTNSGVLFEYTPGATTVVRKFDFYSTYGRSPYGSLLEASNGKLYGLTYQGGSSNSGILFEYTPGATYIVNRFNFNNTFGRNPYGSLMEASNGKLYGMTQFGGSNNNGVIFQHTPGSSSISVIKHLQESEGGYPQYGHLIEVGEEKSWTGNTSTDWNNPANWSMNAVPTATDNVTIPTSPVGGNMPTVNIAGAVVGDITLETGATLTIPSSMALAVDGVLTNDGTVYVNNSGSLVQSTGSTLAGSGSYQVQRQGATGQRFNFWSSPIASQNGVPGTSYTFNSNISTQDESDDQPSDPGWSSFNGAMVPGVGYAGNGGGLATFTGTVNNGDVNVPLVYYAFDNTYTQTSAGTPFNLVGNPYPSAISASQLISDNTNIDGTIYFWDDDLSGGTDYNRTDFAYWNGTGGLGTGAGSVGAPNGSISTAQGFYVRALSSGTLNFNNNQRVAGPNTQFFRMNGEDSRLWFSIETDSLFNQVLIGALEDATEYEDRLYDAVKMRSANGISLSALGNNVEHAIMAFPPPSENKTIPLRVVTESTATHVFKAQTIENFEEFALFLDDAETGNSYEIQEGIGIPIQLDAGEYLDRFYLNLVRTSFTGIENAETLAFSVYAANNLLHVSCPECLLNATVQLVDMRGRTLIELSGQNLKTNTTTIDLNGINAGIYLVRVTTATQTLSQKIFKN